MRQLLIVDVSVVVAVLVQDDAHHARSKQRLRAQEAAGAVFVAPRLLLVEVGGAVARRTGDTELGLRAVQLVGRLPGLQLAPLDARLARRAGELAATLRLRGADACYVAIAERLKAALVSWDKEQLDRAMAGTTVLRLTEVDL